MQPSFPTQLLRTDAIANVALGLAAIGFRSEIVAGFAVRTEILVWLLATGLLVNGGRLAFLAREPRSRELRVSGAIDLAFVAVMIILAVGAPAAWARWAAACLGLVVAIVGAAKLWMARAMSNPTGPNHTGSNPTGPNHTGSNPTGPNPTGPNHTGSNHTGSNPTGRSSVGPARSG